MKSTLKKVLFSLWAIWLVWAGTLATVNAQNTNANNFWEQNTEWTTSDVSVIWDNTTWTWSSSLISTIKTFVNRILWILSLIALIITLRGWFQMLTAAGDETKHKKWLTILKQAAFWLVVIWLAWLFVSLIFYIINKNSVTAGWAWA